MSRYADDWYDHSTHGPGVERRPQVALLLVGFLVLVGLVAVVSRQSRPAPSALARQPNREIDCSIVPERNRFFVGDMALREGPISTSEEDDLEDRFAADDVMLQVATMRNKSVPVRVQLREKEPSDSLDAWDHVVECSLPVLSGELTIGNLRTEQVRLKLPTRPCYRVRVCYAGLASTGEGEDRYHIVLWPGEMKEPIVLKRFAGPKS
jgi:hypothetical protein